jgi:hypothetical protein
VQHQPRVRLVVALLVAAPSLGCETTIQILADDQVVFEAEFIPEDENADFGGTLAFNPSAMQQAPITFLTSAEVKGVVDTEVESSEYVYMETDVEANFQARVTNADWTGLGSPFAPWSWPTRSTAGGSPANHKLPPREIIFGIEIPTAIQSLWRNNHGFCSSEIGKQAIIDGAVPDRNDALDLIGIEEFPFDVDTRQFRALSYMSHPEGLPPTEGATGGVLVNIEGRAEGLGDSSIGIDEILSVELPFNVSDVDFKGSAAIELGLDDRGILTATVPRTPVVSASNVSSCGLHVGCALRILGICTIPLPEVTICLSSEVRDSVRDTLSAAPDAANEVFEDCQAAPIPALEGLGAGPLVSCSTVSDCNPALETLTTLKALSDASSGAAQEVKDAVAAQLSLANFKCATVRSECAGLTGGTPPAGSVCQYVPTAMALNNYPDSIELVWSLAPVDQWPAAAVTPGFALFYALSTPLADSVRGSFCQEVNSSPRKRAFSSITTTDL